MTPGQVLTFTVKKLPNAYLLTVGTAEPLYFTSANALALEVKKILDPTKAEVKPRTVKTNGAEEPVIEKRM